MLGDQIIFSFYRQVQGNIVYYLPWHKAEPGADHISYPESTKPEQSRGKGSKYLLGRGSPAESTQPIV